MQGLPPVVRASATFLNRPQFTGADHGGARRRGGVELHDAGPFSADSGSVLVAQLRVRRQRTFSASRIRRTWLRPTAMPASDIGRVVAVPGVPNDDQGVHEHRGQQTTVSNARASEPGGGGACDCQHEGWYGHSPCGMLPISCLSRT